LDRHKKQFAVRRGKKDNSCYYLYFFLFIIHLQNESTGKKRYGKGFPVLQTVNQRQGIIINLFELVVLVQFTVPCRAGDAIYRLYPGADVVRHHRAGSPISACFISFLPPIIPFFRPLPPAKTRAKQGRKISMPSPPLGSAQISGEPAPRGC
jgi:hypothetical protein